MDEVFLVLGWGSPIGIGIFLLCLGGMIFFLSKASTYSKKDKKE
ncbi:MAG TPA: hypothetical protein VEH58_03705 [Dehalococcoidales bacterium]|nr:hypothetical protein [Dehalococcoidales bacterium]